MRFDRLSTPLITIVLGGIALALAVILVAAFVNPLPGWAAVIAVTITSCAAAAHGWFVVKASFAIADPPKSALETGTPLAAPDGTMRGGWIIGILERVGTCACVATGQFAALAVIVAIKAVGRFGELDKPESRERFIIGTMASLGTAALWGAGAYLFAR